MNNPCFRTITSGGAICLRIGYIFGAVVPSGCLRNGIGMVSECLRGLFDCLNFKESYV